MATTNAATATERKMRLYMAREYSNLRDYWTAAIDSGSLAHHQLVCVVLFLADVLEQLGVGFPDQVQLAVPWLRIGTRIVHCQFVVERRQVRSRDALGRAQLLGVR